MGIRVILSDLHFGTKECSLNLKPVSAALRDFLRSFSNIEEVVFAGDILDVNISSFTRAIEGDRDLGQLGFREWLAFLFKDVAIEIGRIVYIPGNHDYKVWDILSTDKAFVQPYSKGEVPKNLPLMKAMFENPFIKGIAPPVIRDRFVVIYPDYEFDLAGRKVVVTHGHYLDATQNLSTMDLLGYIDCEGKGKTSEAIRKFFIATAQYQALANIASYKSWSRKIATIISKAFCGVNLPKNFIRDFGNIFDPGLRNKGIDSKMLNLIEIYLYYFSEKCPEVFIFGHTHEAGRSYTNPAGKGLIDKPIEVWNDGGFITNKKANRAGTFIIVDDNQHVTEQIKLYEVDLSGNIGEYNA